MSYDIVVRFETEKLANEFCGQMSDGWGEGFCDFSPSFRQKPGTDGTKNDHYERITTQEGEVPAGTRIYFMKRLFEM